MKFILTVCTLLASLTAWGQDSLNVRRLGQIALPGLALDVAVSGNYAYVADGYGGLRIVDISDPTIPTEAGFYDSPGEPRGVWIEGNYAYLAEPLAGLRIVDVSVPSAPEAIGFFPMLDGASDVAVRNDYAYVSTAGLNHFLSILDVSNPESPTQVGVCYSSHPLYRISIEGNYAYVTANADGLRIIDISNPAAPFEAGFYHTSYCGFLDVAVSGNYAYVADAVNGLQIIDITNPTYPVGVSVYDTPGAPDGVAVDGDFAFVTSDGLRVINISDHVGVEVGYYYIMPVDGVAVVGNLAFVVTWSSLGIYDCSAALSSPDPVILSPSSFLLSAYPNPFNATTQIRVDVPRSSLVELRVYDVTGRLVETLASRMFASGTHSLAFDGSNRASGMYVVRMSAAPPPSGSPVHGGMSDPLSPVNGGRWNAAQKVMLVK